MKILIINGSPRNNGVTANVLHMIEKELLCRNAEVEFYNLGEIHMSHCIGCSSCFTTGHCCIHDDAEILSKMIGEADGIVFGSPTYASNVSGIMKDFIDRGHFVIEQLLRNKYSITVATGENYGIHESLKILDNLVLFSGGKLSGHVKVKAPYNDLNGTRDRMFRKIRMVSQRLINGIRHKKSYPVQMIFHSIVFNFGIKPFVKKKGAVYRGVIDKWKVLGIV